MSDTPNHPSAAQLTAFDSGQLPEAERAAIESHVENCPECCQRLDILPEDPLGALVRAFSHRTDEPAPGGRGRTVASEVPPELVGHPRYRILELLGAGGMGVVFKAVHRLMDRVVALKVIHHRLTDRADFVACFRQEVLAAARLNHPAIATAYDAEQVGATHFLVMEYVPGITLDREVRQRGPLPVAEACDLIRQTAQGLQHAHDLGMVHRDIKPANLLRTPDGRVKILDFGLARMVGAPEVALPVDGVILGTPDYLAPEQARDPLHADVRADIYALGCTLYHLLAGRPPFVEATVLQTLLAHQEDLPRPVTEQRDDIPETLADLVARMLARDPARRYRTAAEVAEILGDLADVPNASSSPSAPRRARFSRRGYLLLAATALMSAVSIPLLVRSNRRPPAPVEEPPLPSTNGSPPDSPRLAPPGSLPEVVTVRQGPLSRPILHDIILAWLEANSRWGDKSDFMDRTKVGLDRNLGMTDGYQYTFGPRLMRSRQGTLLAAHVGGVYQVTLPDDLAGPLNAVEGKSIAIPYKRSKEERPDEARVALSRLVVNDPAHVDDRQKIMVSLDYRVHSRGSDNYSLRLMFYHVKGRRTVLWYPPRGTIGDQGTLFFPFPDPSSPDFRFQGPYFAFVEMAERKDGREIIVSNSLGVLLLMVKTD
jgi:serine/threonine protein kinase